MDKCFFFLGTQERVRNRNEPSAFEPLKFYCTNRNAIFLQLEYCLLGTFHECRMGSEVSGFARYKISDKDIVSKEFLRGCWFEL